MKPLDSTSKASKERKAESVVLLQPPKTKKVIKQLRLLALLGQVLDSLFNLIFAILIIGAISSSRTSFLAASPDSAKCTLVSVSNEAKQIKDINDWRSSYGYTENVNAQHLPGCNAYLVTDSSQTKCNYTTIKQETNQTTSITANTYNGDIASSISFEVSYEPYFDHISLYYVYSSSYGRDILAGIAWLNRYGDEGETFLETTKGYDETIFTYNIYTGSYPPSGGYYVDYGPITQITTVQQPCTSCCHPGHAIVGFSGQFEGSYTRYFSWGVDPASCTDNCTVTTYHAANDTSTGILGAVGNATFFPSDTDPCNEMSGVAAINYLDFLVQQCFNDYQYNANLLTPYGKYPKAYLYRDIYDANVTHVPVEMGCSNDPYDGNNMIDPGLDSRHDSTSMFLVLCWILSLCCFGLSTKISYEKLTSDDDTSELEEYLEESLQEVVLWKCCCKCWCGCCYGDEGYRGYLSVIVDILQYAVAFPIGILAPYDSRANNFGCFSIWDGVLDDDTSAGIGITWLVCFGFLVVYVTMRKLVDAAECRLDDGCCRCLKGFYELLFIGTFFGTLLVLVGISVVGKVAEIENIASVVVTGINIPSLKSVLRSIHIDGITINRAVQYFLGYQITRMIGLAFIVLKRFLYYCDRCAEKFK